MDETWREPDTYYWAERECRDCYSERRVFIQLFGTVECWDCPNCNAMHSIEVEEEDLS